MKFNKIKEDNGDANAVSFIVIIFFIMIMLVSFVDAGLYFNIRNEMQAAAENGARNVAIYGGVQTSLWEARTASRGVIQTPEEVVASSIQSQFQNAKSKTVAVSDIFCGPETATAGSEVYCEVSYKYIGLAGKFGLFNLGRDDKDVAVRGTSVSEVTSD